jgi:hypothetical protein
MARYRLALSKSDERHKGPTAVAAAKQKRLFLYTDATALGGDATKILLANGFIPVKVADLDTVRIVEPTLGVDLSGQTLDAAASAALDAIAAYNGDHMPATFGRRFLKLLAAKKSQS